MSKVTHDRGRGQRISRKATPAKAERRDITAKRLSYEALVDVGGDTGGFEAESVDVSLDGIRLRTAYMPDLGERLAFRFDGFGGEVVAEGEVAWCQAARRGGEFGVRFTSLEPRAARMLYAMCEQAPVEQASEPAAVSEPEPEEPSAQPGDRVRLHIKGLGSPMRARVRDVARGEVLVGSSLEFLKVGRDLELESVAGGTSRIAHIEHVGVEIDPETNVPQLVVALSYDRPSDAPQALEDQLATVPFRVGGEASRRDDALQVSRASTEDRTPEPHSIDRAPAQQLSSFDEDFEEVPTTLPTSLSPGAQAVEADDYGAEDQSPDAPQATARVAELANKLKPGIAAVGAGAKSVLGKVFAAVRDKRSQRRASAKRGRTPKRTTAPPPSGALRSDGRRVFRQQHPQRDAAEATPESQPPPAPRSEKKRAVFGAVLGVLAVLAIYFASSQLKGDDTPDKDPALAAAAADPAAAPAVPPPGQPLGVPGANVPALPAGGTPIADVPLFGATPMSTTEVVPMPPDPNAPPAESDAREPPSGGGAAALKLEKEWGVGEVHNPTVLRLRMNGKPDGLHGKESATGFTVIIPGRKSVSSTSGLARKDKRIESVNVVNFPDRAEVTVRFKGEIPPYIAKVKGKKLLIEISSAKKKRKKRSNKKRKKR